EGANLVDALDGQRAPLRSEANGLGSRCVVCAERLRLAGADAPVDPGHLICGIALCDCQPGPGTGFIDGNLKCVWNLSLDDITWHGVISQAWLAEAFTAHTVRPCTWPQIGAHPKISRPATPFFATTWRARVARCADGHVQFPARACASCRRTPA